MASVGRPNPCRSLSPPFARVIIRPDDGLGKRAARQACSYWDRGRLARFRCMPQRLTCSDLPELSDSIVMLVIPLLEAGETPAVPVIAHPCPLCSSARIEFKTILIYNFKGCAPRLSKPTVATHVVVSRRSEATFI